jgi:hypothetical protein
MGQFITSYVQTQVINSFINLFINYIFFNLNSDENNF